MPRPICTYFLSLLLFPSLLMAQEIEHGGYYGRPPVILGTHYRTTDAAEDHAVFGSLSLIPRYIQTTILNRRLKPLPGYIHHGFITGIRAGVAFDTAGNRRTLWRAALLDMDLSSVAFHLRWNAICGDVPLHMRPIPSGLGHLVGLTLLDYDKSGRAELDARWVQIRAGFIYNSNATLAPHIRAVLSAGGTTFKPGTINYNELGEEPNESLTGLEVGADVAIGLETTTPFNIYGSGRRSLLIVTVDGKLRTVTADRTIGLLSFGATLRGFIAFPGTCESSGGAGRGFELLLRIRREFIRSGTAEQRTDMLETGLQYSFEL